MKIDISEKNAKVLKSISAEQWEALTELRETLLNRKKEEKDSNKVNHNLEVKVGLYLRDIGVLPNILGYDYFKYGIILVLGDESYKRAITSRLYPDVAKAFNATSSRVDRAMRHAIEVAYGKKNKPTNSEFIANVVEELKYN